MKKNSDILQEKSIIDQDISSKMKAMVAFRNIAVHDDQSINLDILEQIISKHLDDFMEYKKQILAY
ncbi:type VII toxin-antitoxin system HepT family RNase toxin [Bacillus sp. SJS]|uniref:type VII toxin-antitoxin system HepT family RNase toxin n=1 Tax=Bacillus sp. SJS TaxID=1423321 RepID=UPI003FA480E6